MSSVLYTGFSKYLLTDKLITAPLNSLKINRQQINRARESPQRLSSLASLAGALMAHNYPNLSFQGIKCPLLVSVDTRHPYGTHTYMLAKHSST